jgi:cytoskeleton protein RodZ
VTGSTARAPLAAGAASAGSSGSAQLSGDGTPAAGSGSGQGVIRFTTTENSWVAVRDATGRQIHGAVVPAGTTIAVQGKPPYQLTLGNAARMKVQYEGKDRKVPPPNEKNIARLELP